MNPFRFIDGLARRVFLPFAGWKINTYTCKLACVSLVPPQPPPSANPFAILLLTLHVQFFIFLFALLLAFLPCV